MRFLWFGKSIPNGLVYSLQKKFNRFFQSVAAHPHPLTEDLDFLTQAAAAVPDRFAVSVGEAERQLTYLNSRKTTGPDETPAWILRDFAHHLWRAHFVLFLTAPFGMVTFQTCGKPEMQSARSPTCLVKWCAAFSLNHSSLWEQGGHPRARMVTCHDGTPQGTLLGSPVFIIHLPGWI